MLVCPHCQFENPTDNRFCQRCGNPLRGLRAIITRLDPSMAVAAHRDASEAAKIVTPHATGPLDHPSVEALALADWLPPDGCLDVEKRYQLRYVADTAQPLSQELEVEVVDCQPAGEPPISRPIEAANSQNHPSGDISNAHLPSWAYPYWKLQAQLFPVVPELQAAWQQQAYAVVVIEDRSKWQQLSDMGDIATTEPIQIIHWFYEMAELWESLAVFEAEPSLLNQRNLLVDDDQILCLRRLLYRPSGLTHSLEDLGLFWQALMQSFTAFPLEQLEMLATEVGSGGITDLTHVKERLANIAGQFQETSSTPAYPVMSNEDSSGRRDIGDSPDITTGQSSEGVDLECFPAAAEVTTPRLNSATATETRDADFDDAALFDGVEDPDEDDTAEESVSDLPTMVLPMKLHRLDQSGQTHVGRQRDHNEDSFYIDTSLHRIQSPSGETLKARGLYILCDGMGGHAGGEIASALAVDTLRDYFEPHWQTDLPSEAAIKTGIIRANQIIFSRNEAEGRTANARMGTTLVMLLLMDNQAVVAHVGDSRLYCCTRKGLQQITVDHEVGQREIARGVDLATAYARPDAYQLTQALGPRNNNEVVPSISTFQLSQDTLFLLCSDGLSDNDLLEKHVETHIEPLLRSRADLEEGVANLIDLANEHNGHDNITAIAVRAKLRPNLEAART